MSNDVTDVIPKGDDVDISFDEMVMMRYRETIDALQQGTGTVITGKQEAFLTIPEEDRKQGLRGADAAAQLRVMADLIESKSHMIMSVNYVVIEATPDSPQPLYHAGFAGDKGTQFMSLQNELIGCSLRIMEQVKIDLTEESVNPNPEGVH